jgi:aminoglycoside phosphotransferase family enzyme/predicted kinase
LPAQSELPLPELIAGLSRPDAYAHPVKKVEVIQTHISVVFLTGDFAYKVKKPVNLGFLDFSTLEQRKHFCEEEVRLNRRLAPQVYLGVVPVTKQDWLRIGGDGPVVEWAVQMKRLPQGATLESQLRHGDVQPQLLRTLAERLAEFHRHADANARIASFGRYDVVAQNARENFKQTEPHLGITVSAAVYERVRERTEALLQQQRPLIEARASRSVPRDTHGDLHLDHVYLFPNEPPPSDLVMIDCIEFSDRFRYADPVADVAFLVMDLHFHARRDLARIFADAYFQAAGDAEGRLLLPFYSAYRAMVRAKVEGMELSETEIDPGERAEAQARARAHWLLALGELESPSKRPAVLMLAGLPGTGKSTLARSLAQQAHFHIFRSDVIRKELAEQAHVSEKAVTFDEGIYERSWTQCTYAEMLNRAEQCWWTGERVLIDANFREEAQRQQFLQAAQHWGVPALLLHCQVPAEVARQRLQARHRDASDADWKIHQALAESWKPFAITTARFVHAIDTSGTAEQTAAIALQILQDTGLR